MFDQIESLKRQYTDQYVIVNGSVPELARFKGHVGQVKTVNMNGRALVEFDAWANIGWYDIDLDCLKVVPKPEPKAAGEKHEKREAPAKPAAKAAPAAATGEKKLSPLEMARMQGAAKSAGAPAPAAAKPAASAAKPAAPAAGKMSTADILAAARAKKAAESAAAAPAAAEVETPVAAAPPAPAAKPAAAAPTLAKGQRPGISEILAWCRAHDAK